MKTYKCTFLFFLCLPWVSYCQELEIRVNLFSRNNYDLLQPKYKFNDRYGPQTNTTFSLRNTSFYKLKKVRKIEVYNSNHVLSWMAEFDTNGIITKQGAKGLYYFITNEIININENSKIQITGYYDSQKLMRVDTTVISVFSYKNLDTLISFTRTETKVYKRGSLINEQNDYYNEKYFDKPLNNQSNPEFIFNGSIEKVNNIKPAVYFDKKFKTDYDTGLLYFCSVHVHDEEFKATVDSDKKIIEVENLLSHAFVQKYKSQDAKKCMTDGECFVEPTEYLEPFRGCGFSAFKEMEYSRNSSFGYSINEKGLHDTYYHYYIPIGENKPHQKSILFTYKYAYFEH